MAAQSTSALPEPPESPEPGPEVVGAASLDPPLPAPPLSLLPPPQAASTRAKPANSSARLTARDGLYQLQERVDVGERRVARWALAVLTHGYAPDGGDLRGHLVVNPLLVVVGDDVLAQVPHHREVRKMEWRFCARSQAARPPSAPARPAVAPRALTGGPPRPRRTRPAGTGRTPQGLAPPRHRCSRRCCMCRHTT